MVKFKVGHIYLNLHPIDKTVFTLFIVTKSIHNEVTMKILKSTSIEQSVYFHPSSNFAQNCQFIAQPNKLGLLLHDF